MTEYAVRFLVGGALVSAFAMLGDICVPRASPAYSEPHPPSRSLRSPSPSTGTERTTQSCKVRRWLRERSRSPSTASSSAISLSARNCEPRRLRCYRLSSG